MAELARDPSSIVSFVVVSPGAATASVTYGFGQPLRSGHDTSSWERLVAVSRAPPASLMSLLLLPPPPLFVCFNIQKGYC